MMVLADEGDSVRKDASCGVLYGTLRDSAYKIRELAETERELHKEIRLSSLFSKNALCPSFRFVRN